MKKINYNKKIIDSKKTISKNNTTKEFSKLEPEEFILISPKKRLNHFNKKVKANNSKLSGKLEENKKSKNSLCTASTSTSELIKNNKKKKIKNKMPKKFIDAQNKWRKDYCANFIQKVFRGFYYRKKCKNNLNKTKIYKKKKIQITDTFKHNIKSNSIEQSNNNNNHKQAIKTIIIDKLEKKVKSLNNNLKI